MSSTLLDLGFFEIKWYSALILLAFIIGYGLVISRCKKKGLNTSKISDMCFYLVIVCIFLNGLTDYLQNSTSLYHNNQDFSSL